MVCFYNKWSFKSQYAVLAYKLLAVWGLALVLGKFEEEAIIQNSVLLVDIAWIKNGRGEELIWRIKTLKTAKAVNEDPACLYVGSHRRSNQPNLKNNDEKCKDYCKADTT